MLRAASWMSRRRGFVLFYLKLGRADMQSGVGAAASFGWETTWSTPVTAATEIPILSESMRVQDPRIQDQSSHRLWPVFDSKSWLRGKPLIFGQVTMPIWPTGIEELWRVALGDYTWNAGASFHEFGAGWLWEDRGWTRSFTMTISVGGQGITDTWKTYAGCVIRGFRINVPAGDIATVTWDIVAATETIATTGPVSSIATVGQPFLGEDKTVFELFGASFLDVRRFEVSISRNLDIAFSHDSETIRAPFYELARPTISALAVMEFDTTNETPDWYEYHYRGATPVPADIDFRLINQDGAEMRIEAPAARVDGSTPLVLGPGPILVDVPMTLLGDATDSTAAALKLSIDGSGTL